MTFKPERFLASCGSTPELDPNAIAFGFGRRICPGRRLVNSGLYITIAQILAVFKISKPVKNGRESTPEVVFLPGVISHPAPYEVTIKPRSPQHESLVRGVEQIYPWEESDAKTLESVQY
jgi:cytochrome P450